MRFDLTDVPGERRCGARTRDGDPCKNWGKRNGRCRMHGGNAASGMASGTYIHGDRSKDPLCRVWQVKRKHDEQVAARTEAMMEAYQERRQRAS